MYITDFKEFRHYMYGVHCHKCAVAFLLLFVQGFHVMVDTHDGFGGVGAQTLQHLADEYTSKSLMTFGFTPANLPDDVSLLLLKYLCSLTSDFQTLGLINTWKTWVFLVCNILTDNNDNLSTFT